MKHIIKLNNSNTLLDKFYTKPKVAESCVSFFQSNVTVNKTDLIIEPAAGDGSFIPYLNKIKSKKLFTDIAPNNKQIKQQDFLLYNPCKVSGKIHVIGNPPFGRQASTCFKFIKHSSKFCSTISFILPMSFKKESLIEKIPKNFHLVNEKLLPLKSFTNENLSIAVPTVFQI